MSNDMKLIEFHPLCYAYPDITGSDLDELRQSIQDQGLLVPIKIWNGKIIDGRHRYNICTSIGVELKYDDVSTIEESKLQEYVKSLNSNRRHLSKSKIAIWIAEQTLDFQGGRLNRPGGSKPEFKTEDLCHLNGVSLDTVDRVKKVLRLGRDHIVKQMRDGEIPIKRAWALTNEVLKDEYDRGITAPGAVIKSTSEVASELNISSREIDRAKYVVKNGSNEVKSQVKSGEIGLKTAEKLVRDSNPATVKPLNRQQMSSNVIFLDDWKSNPDQSRLYVPSATKGMNNQGDTVDIEWAKYSWNPIYGCLHGCSYCYARDIANHFGLTFKPRFHADRLKAPYLLHPSDELVNLDMAHKNIFVCSMSDLFGKWVPIEWINAVLKTIVDNPQLNFLLLTKFPQRLSEFDFPDNAWVGISTPTQQYVNIAEKYMPKVNAKIKWLSIEPLLEPLKFEHPETYQWVVIGGASPSKTGGIATPLWHPPIFWTTELTELFRSSGARVYHKCNLFNVGTTSGKLDLLNRSRDWPGFNPDLPSKAPDVFFQTIKD